jgi:hypothetical protein
VEFVLDKAALGQVFSEYFGFPCQSFHQFLHHHNHPGLAQQAYWWPQCQVDPNGLHPPLYQLKKMPELLYNGSFAIFRAFLRDLCQKDEEMRKEIQKNITLAGNSRLCK